MPKTIDTSLLVATTMGFLSATLGLSLLAGCAAFPILGAEKVAYKPVAQAAPYVSLAARP